MKQLIFTVSFLWFVFLGLSQQQKTYFVYFKDKGGVEYLPNECLSQRAIERYELNNVTFSYQDYKVFPEYIDSIRHYGEYRYSSKWHNGVIITLLDSNLNNVKSISFVDSVVFIGQNNLKPKLKGLSKSSRLLSSSTEEIVKRKALLGIDATEKAGYSGEGVWLAIFDAGFQGVNTIPQFDHLLSNSKIVETLDIISNDENVYTKHDHGTNSLGGIVGITDDTLNLGAAPQVNIGMYITEDISSEQPLEMYWWAVAIERVDSMGYDIVSNSLGYSDFDAPFVSYEYSQFDGNSLLISKSASIAGLRGIVIVTSAGNFGNSKWRYLAAPGDAENVITVGAVDLNRDLGVFSSLGPSFDGRIKPDVCGVGVQTNVLNKIGQLIPANGTSFSAPQIAGSMAVLKQMYPFYTRIQLAQLLFESGSQYDSPDNQKGYGVPNLSSLVLGSEKQGLSSKEGWGTIYKIYTMYGELLHTSYEELNEGFYIIQYKKGFKLESKKVFKY